MYFGGWGQLNIVQFMATAKVKCRHLEIHNALLEKVNIVELYKISGASSFEVARNERARDFQPIPLPFDTLRQLEMAVSSECNRLLTYMSKTPNFGRAQKT